MSNLRKVDPTSGHPVNAHRRTILGTALFGIPGAWLASRSLGVLQAAPAASARAPDDFTTVSRLLTGHPEIDVHIADAAWSALIQRETDFGSRFEQLSSALSQAPVQDFHQLKGSTVLSDAALKATAVQIVGAWYLGRVGNVNPRSEDGPAFVTYTGALMWRPTLDVTVLPSYVRGKPGFWAEKPASVATD